METWTIAVIVIGCAIAVGLVVGIPIYVVMDRKRKRRGNEDPFAMSESQQDENERASQWPSANANGFPQLNANAPNAVLNSSDLRQLSSQQQAMLNSPYQRFSLNVGGPTRLFAGSRVQHPALLTSIPTRGPSYFPSYHSSQPDLANVQPIYVPRNNELARPGHSKIVKANKNNKFERSSSETGLNAGFLNPYYVPSPTTALAYHPGPRSFLSDLPTYSAVVSPSSHEPLYLQRKQVIPQKSESFQKNDRKDLHRWNSSGDIRDSAGETDFADVPYFPRMDLQPIAATPVSADALGRPSKRQVKHNDKLGHEQVLNATRLAEEARLRDQYTSPAGIRIATELREMRGPLNTLDVDAVVRSKHSSLVAVTNAAPQRSNAVTDTDMLVFGRRANSEQQANWQTRARAIDSTPLAEAQLQPERAMDAVTTSAPSKPLARIPPTPGTNDPIYSKPLKINKPSDEINKPNGDEKTEFEARQKRLDSVLRNTTRSQQDLQTVTDMFGFLDVMANS